MPKAKKKTITERALNRSKKKTTKERALHCAKKLDALLNGEGKLFDELDEIQSAFCIWHTEQWKKVPNETWSKWSDEGPMACVEGIEKALFEAREILKGTAVEWCNNNNYKE